MSTLHPVTLFSDTGEGEEPCETLTNVPTLCVCVLVCVLVCVHARQSETGLLCCFSVIASHMANASSVAAT